MPIENLNAASLQKLIKKLERRDALAAEIKAIEADIAGFFGNAPVPAAPKATKAKRRSTKKAGKAPSASKTGKAAPPAAKGRKTGRRGALKAKIMAALSQAGISGVAVRDLAKKFKMKPQNIHVWFSSTGKNIPEIERLGEGRYRIS
jgi:hypothetical protein